MSEDGLEFSGLLYKKRGGIKKHMPNAWQSRYCAISNQGVLVYFDADKPIYTAGGCLDFSQAKGALDLVSTPCVLKTEEPIEGSPTQYVFKICPLTMSSSFSSLKRQSSSSSSSSSSSFSFSLKRQNSRTSVASHNSSISMDSTHTSMSQTSTTGGAKSGKKWKLCAYSAASYDQWCTILEEYTFCSESEATAAFLKYNKGCADECNAHLSTTSSTATTSVTGTVIKDVKGIRSHQKKMLRIDSMESIASADETFPALSPKPSFIEMSPQKLRLDINKSKGDRKNKITGSGLLFPTVSMAGCVETIVLSALVCGYYMFVTSDPFLRVFTTVRLSISAITWDRSSYFATLSALGAMDVRDRNTLVYFILAHFILGGAFYWRASGSTALQQHSAQEKAEKTKICRDSSAVASTPTLGGLQQNDTKSTVVEDDATTTSSRTPPPAAAAAAAAATAATATTTGKQHQQHLCFPSVDIKYKAGVTMAEYIAPTQTPKTPRFSHNNTPRTPRTPHTAAARTPRTPQSHSQSSSSGGGGGHYIGSIAEEEKMEVDVQQLEREILHTWSRIEALTFAAGLTPRPDYPHLEPPPPSTPMYEPFAVDMFQYQNGRVDDVASRFDLPDTENVQTNHAAVPPLLIVQWQVPTELPQSMFDFSATDQSGWALVIYFRITQNVCTQLKDLNTASAAVKLFAQWCEKAPTDASWRRRLKMVGAVENLSEFGLPFSLLAYNMNPMCVGHVASCKSPVTEGQKPEPPGMCKSRYMEIDINVHSCAKSSKQSIITLLSKCAGMFLQMGFAIEANDIQELPEELIGCVQINKPQERRLEFLFEDSRAASEQEDD